MSFTEDFLESLFANVRPKGESPGNEDARPLFTAKLLREPPDQLLLMMPTDFAAYFSATMAGRAPKNLIARLEGEGIDDQELAALYGDTITLVVKPAETQVQALADSLNACEGGPAFLARVAVALKAGYANRRARVHMFSPKEA